MPVVPHTDGLTVLVLAGELREVWARALEAEGFLVRSPGWLDAITAAHLERPDAVLISSDLPASAAATMIAGFRCSAALRSIPLVVAGLSDAELADARGPYRADRHVPSPVAPSALGREVRAAIRGAGTPVPRTRAERAALAVASLGLFAMALRVLLLEPLSRLAPSIALPPALDGALLLGGLAASVVGTAAAVAMAPRKLTLRRWRTLIGWLAVVLPFLGDFLAGEGRYPNLVAVGFSLACVAGIAWALLGLRLRPTARPWLRRWYVTLAVLLAVLGAAAWTTEKYLRG